MKEPNLTDQEFVTPRLNESLDRMPRSAVSRTLQIENPWRAPRHRLALR